MVSLVLVSHSYQVAQGVKEMALQMLSGKISIAAAGGTKERTLGTDVSAIQEAIRSVLGPEGVVVLVDIGGAVISVETALEGIDPTDRDKVVIADAPWSRVRSWLQPKPAWALAYLRSRKWQRKPVR